MNSVSVANNWFSSLFTNNLIGPMSKYGFYLNMVGGHAKKAVREVGELNSF